MSKTSNIIKYTIALAALAVFLFTLLQLLQHGYDAPGYVESLEVEFQPEGTFITLSITILNQISYLNINA